MTNGISEESPRSRGIKRSAGSRGQSGVSAGAFVYVIAADNGEVKIGVSGTPYARLSKIKREYGQRRGFASAKLVGFIQTPWPMAVEASVIRALLAHATGGEWFRIDAEAAMSAVLAEAQRQDAAASIIRPALPKRPRAVPAGP